MMSSKQEYFLQSYLELVLKNVLHHLVAGGIESLSILIDHSFEVFDTCLERGKHTLDVSLKVLKLLILNMHNLELSKNFQKLLVYVIDEGVH